MEVIDWRSRGFDGTNQSRAIGVEADHELAKLWDNYDLYKTPSYNIFKAIELGTFPTAYPITLRGIHFDEPEGKTITLPSNVRLENCTMKNGKLHFVSNHAEAPANVEKEDDWKSLVGLYYTEKTLSENILLALVVGNFPTSAVTFEDIIFLLPMELTVSFLENVTLDDCVVSGGCVKFVSGKLTAKNVGAIAYADGPAANAFSTCGALACANNGASAYAYDGGQFLNYGGKSFALSETSEAYARGKNSKSYGLVVCSKIYAVNGATCCANVVGVISTVDRDSRIEYTALRKDTPPYYRKNNIHYSKERYDLFFNHLSELNDLSNAGDAKSAFALAMMPEDHLRDFFAHGNPTIFFLERAHDLGHKEAAFLLAEYLMKRKLIPKGEDVKNALMMYKAARDIEHKDAQQKIDQIEARGLSASCTIF